jgi:succinyl-CoA synthetase beta subunit
MAGAIQGCLGASRKPVLAYVSPHAPEAAALMTDLGIPSFIEPESCAAALSAMIFAEDGCVPVMPPMAGPTADLGDIPSGWLDERQAKALFARAGVPGAREIVATTAEEAAAAAAALGGKVVLKVLSSQIVHKTEVGGVAVGQTPKSIGARLAQMTTEVAKHTGTEPTAFLVQETVTDGIELILGMKHDPLGTAILLGAGGVTAEILRDTAMRLMWPGVGLTADEALALVRSLKTWPLLDGYRGRPKADVDALVAAIVAFSGMVAQLGDRLQEAEINPLFVLPAGSGVRAADGVIALKT